MNTTQKTVFDYKATLLSGEEVKMLDYKGTVLLIINVATMSDKTATEFKQMNDLAETLGKKLQILAFPCNQFGNQVSYYILINKQ